MVVVGQCIRDRLMSVWISDSDSDSGCSDNPNPNPLAKHHIDETRFLEVVCAFRGIHMCVEPLLVDAIMTVEANMSWYVLFCAIFVY